MVCSNPVKVTLSARSPVHTPTAVNAGFSLLLLCIFAYIHKDRSLVIKGTPTGKPTGTATGKPATVPTAPQSS